MARTNKSEEKGSDVSDPIFRDSVLCLGELDLDGVSR